MGRKARHDPTQLISEFPLSFGGQPGQKGSESGGIGKREKTESREVCYRALKGSRMRVRKHLGWSAAMGTPGQKPC